ncbi:MAG: anaerobic sulfatase maturase [Draconibacterium sp.]
MNRNRSFQIFTKPVGDSCNLNCSYCYYHTDASINNSNLLISDDVFLEEYIRQQIEATTDETVFFSWHGGEPTVAGIEFYSKALDFQTKHLPTGKKLLNGIQTNGTLLNEYWCRFLSSAGFIVGISIDGPEHLHNCFRQSKNGSSTFESVINGFRLLQKHQIPTEILCVVSAGNENYPLEVYRFFKALGARFITFLPLVERIGNSNSVSKRSVNAEAYGHFMITVFDEWVQKNIGSVQVQLFEEALRSAFDNEHSLCIFKQNCGGVPVIESDGNFYSCDHFVNKENLVGNICEQSVADLLDSEKQLAFGRAKSATLPGYCKKCEVLKMCNGECPKNRFIVSPDGESGLNYLCAGHRMFFNHCRPFIEEIRKAAILGV